MNDRLRPVPAEEPEEQTLAQAAIEHALNRPDFDAELFHEAWEARMREITAEIKGKLADIKVQPFDLTDIHEAISKYWEGIDEEEKAAKAEVMADLKKQITPRGIIFNTIHITASIWLNRQMVKRGMRPIFRILVLVAFNDLVAYIQDPERTRESYEEIKLRLRTLRHG